MTDRKLIGHCQSEAGAIKTITALNNALGDTNLQFKREDTKIGYEAVLLVFDSRHRYNIYIVTE